jgi:hypothetical protein
MFTTDYFIDAFQTGKKLFVTSFVQDEKTKDALTDFIDQQTEYTKQAYSAGVALSSKLGDQVVATMSNLPKFDLAKAFDTSSK